MWTRFYMVAWHLTLYMSNSKLKVCRGQKAYHFCMSPAKISKTFNTVLRNRITSLIFLIFLSIIFSPTFTIKLIIWHIQCWCNSSFLCAHSLGFIKIIVVVLVYALSNVNKIALLPKPQLPKILQTLFCNNFSYMLNI